MSVSRRNLRALGNLTGMALLLYLLGFLVLASGLACIATLFGVAQIYVCAGVLSMLAVAVITAIASMRTPPQEPA